MVTGPGGACFHSESNDRVVPVSIEVWSAEPQDVEETWQVIAEGTMAPDSPQVRLRTVTGDLTDKVVNLTGPMAHHVRAALRTTPDLENEGEYETNVQEEWLIQPWPTS